MKVIVYLTTNLINKKIYIGVHECKEHETSFYIGNGVYNTQPSTYMHPKTKFQAAVKKYGPKNFKRVTIKEFDNDDDAYFLESELVDKEFLKRPDVYNMVLGGKGGDIAENAKTCYQYDLNGNFIKEYSSQAKAADSVGRVLSTIRYAIINKVKAANFFWSYEKFEKLDLSDFKTSDNRICVYQYSSDGQYDCCYESVSDAGRVNNMPSTNISRACKMGYLSNNKYFSYEFHPFYIKPKNLTIRGSHVYQYSLEGQFIKEYSSCNQAEKELNVKRGLSTAIKLGRIFAGFQWSLEKLDSMSPIQNPPKKARKVGQYNLEGELIKIFNTVTECTKEFSGCRHVLQGRNKTSGGYIFKYIDD